MKKANKTLLIVVGVLVLLVIAVLAWGISANNRFVTMRANIEQSQADVETVLQRRADLIPNLVNTVKGYAAHEEELYTALADARASYANAGTFEDKLEANDEISSALSRLLVIVENYPELKASQNFTDLQTQLEGTENRIAIARQNYSDAVGEYNAAIQRFPGSLIAGMFGFDKEPYFEASEAAQSNPQVSFD